MEGKADFGVCTSSVLNNRTEGRKLVVLGVIFQHSAASLIVPRRAGITSLSELEGHRLMDAPDSDDLAAMLKSQGVDYKALPRVNHNGDPADLLNGKAALSPEMAVRVEKAFGVSMDTLLRMQAWYDTFTMRERAAEIAVERFVPDP